MELSAYLHSFETETLIWPCRYFKLDGLHNFNYSREPDGRRREELIALLSMFSLTLGSLRVESFRGVEEDLAPLSTKFTVLVLVGATNIISRQQYPVYRLMMRGTKVPWTDAPNPFNWLKAGKIWGSSSISNHCYSLTFIAIFSRLPHTAYNISCWITCDNIMFGLT
jgi:hypothetical protein